MIKRISILVRRPQDSRAAFTAHWSGTHGDLVAQLPLIARYTQNHVVEVLPVVLPDVAPYDIDGFVELYFASEESLRTAFAGDIAAEIWKDEPNFLEHSTAYQIAGDQEPAPTLSDAKLVLVAEGTAAAMDWLTEVAARLPLIEPPQRNDVAQVIARATMSRGPQPASLFLHLRLATAEVAQAAAHQLASQDLLDAASHGIARLAITRVLEHRVK